MATASTPVKNASATGWRGWNVASADGTIWRNWNTPARFSPISVNNSANAATTAGFCNWKPQPRLSPAWRSDNISRPSAMKLSSTPAV